MKIDTSRLHHCVCIVETIKKMSIGKIHPKELKRRLIYYSKAYELKMT